MEEQELSGGGSGGGGEFPNPQADLQEEGDDDGTDLRSENEEIDAEEEDEEYEIEMDIVNGPPGDDEWFSEEEDNHWHDNVDDYYEVDVVFPDMFGDPDSDGEEGQAFGVEHDDDDDDDDDLSERKPPPPRVEFESSPEWTAGPGGSGGHHTTARMWTTMTSSSLHDQTADALNLWTSPEEALEITLVQGSPPFPRAGITVYRFVAERVGHRPIPVAAANLPVPGGYRCSIPYTLTRSSDGITLALGMESGVIFIYTLNESRTGKVLRLDLQIKLGQDMINNLRFLMVDSLEYLVASDQSGRIWMFSNPNTSENTLGDALPWSEYKAPPFAERAPDGTQPNWRLVSMVGVCSIPSQGQNDPVVYKKSKILAIGFPFACNAAQPSPSGRYLAVLVDGSTGMIIILRRDQGFRYDGWNSAAAHVADPSIGQAHLPLIDGPYGPQPYWARPLHRDESGANFGGQYCCWNADETLLAASSDSFHSVIVWATPSGDCPTFRQLMRVEDTLTEALALAFHPSDPGLLCFSERRDRLYLIDVLEEVKEGGVCKKGTSARTLQTFSSTGRAVRHAWRYPLHILNGVAMTRDSLFAASTHGLLEVDLIKPWSYQEHMHFPKTFKAAARTFLMCASRGVASPTSSGIAGLTLQDLPMNAVGKVIEKLAAFYKSYFPRCSERPSIRICQ